MRTTKTNNYFVLDQSPRIRASLSFEDYSKFVLDARAERLKPSALLRQRALIADIDIKQAQTQNTEFIEHLKLMVRQFDDIVSNKTGQGLTLKVWQSIICDINTFIETHHPQLSENPSRPIITTSPAFLSQPVSARVTEPEYYKIQKRFNKTGLPNLAEFLRMVCLQSEVSIVSNKAEAYIINNLLNRMSLHLKRLQYAMERHSVRLPDLDFASQNITNILADRNRP